MTPWTVLHTGHVVLPGSAAVVALLTAVLLALGLRYLGVLDTVGGAFVAGRERDD